MELFGFLPVTWKDILDILVVAFVFYKMYQVLRGSRAAQMMAGLALILVASFIVDILNMSGMTWLIRNVQTVWVIAFVILFQPELRRILLQIGQSRIARRIFRVESFKTIDTVVQAAFDLSKKHWGALIVMLRDTSLRTIIEKGVSLKADATPELILSIFNPQSPLHDGAIVIQSDIVEAAKCILPLSDSPTVDPRLGTRHLAALGLSEESDAVTIVVSEETEKVSVAWRGIFHRGLDEAGLRGILNQAFLPTARK